MEGSAEHTIAGCERRARGEEKPAKERAMIPRKKKCAREYMANLVANAQHHDSMGFTGPSSATASRSYQARLMIESMSVRSILC